MLKKIATEHKKLKEMGHIERFGLYLRYFRRFSWDCL